MADQNVRTRQWLAIFVVVLGVAATAVLGCIIIAYSTDKYQGAQLVLTGVLPLVGTWIGTVLAFYFARENFESAANKTKELVQLGQEGGSVNTSDPVSKHMLALKDMKVYQPKIAPDAKAKDININAVAQVINKSDFDRLPVLDTNDAFKYLLTGATVNRAIVQLTAADPNIQLAKLTLEDVFKSDAALERRCTQLVAFVKKDATMGDAKTAMELVDGCRDVFVTKSGSPKDEVIGWVSNNKILREAAV